MNTTVIPERLARVESAPLRRGKGPAPNGEFDVCVMQAVAYVAGEKDTDHPVCASKVLTAFMISWNDSLDDEDRQRLKPYIPRLVGTKASAKVEEKRAWMAADWLVRTFTPAWLRLAKLDDHAAALEALPEMTTTAAIPIIDAARAAAWAAAWAAARAAAWDAAGDAARAAAWAAARAAAWDAAGDAAGAAAGAAAWAAGGDALKTTTHELQDSAFALLDRMIEA